MGADNYDIVKMLPSFLTVYTLRFDWAGPLITAPVVENTDPWHGQGNEFPEWL